MSQRRHVCRNDKLLVILQLHKGKRGQETRPAYKMSRLAPSDPVPLARLYFLKVLQQPQTTPPAGEVKRSNT